ncbi:MAG: hypothetical protein JNM82_15685 [Rhodocyclaceae bacterium]|nr:hypothetical protein [Rhodocyclaceae bacterium]
MKPRYALILPAVLALAACEQLGIDDPVKVAAAKEAEAKAMGSACRHSGRNLEDCYDTNPKASKAAIFAGWREMDAYMRENKIEVVLPEGKPEKQTGHKEAAAPDEEKPAPKETAPAKKGAAAKGAASGSGRGVRITQVDRLYLLQQIG